MQQHQQMHHTPTKYEPPRYMCPNNLFIQQQQQLQLQNYQHYQQQPQHPQTQAQSQSQLQQHQYPLYSQQPQPPLPALPPKPANLTTSLKQNTPLLRSYMKPLPKLPTELEESREMSSTDDLSSRPHSPSMSSSDESYSKTTEGEGEEDSPRLTAANNHANRNGANPLQWLYPCDIQVDPTSPVIDMSNLKDFEVSSTTESQGQYTTTTQNKGDSCNSFEYQDRLVLAQAKQNNGAGSGVANGGGGNQNATKSPFERELQRLLNESSRARGLATTTHNSTAATASSSTGGNITSVSGGNAEGGNTTSNSSSRNNIDISYSGSNSKLSSNGLNVAAGIGGSGSLGSNGNLSGSTPLSGNNNLKNVTTAMAATILDELNSPTTGRSKIPVSTSFMIAKHPVGLEAIKEITRNKNPSESSQM